MAETNTPINMEQAKGAAGIWAPLRTRLFRNIWLASLLSNLGFMFLSVGAGWQMTLLTTRAEMVALVQTALMLPMMLLAIPAGAMADMYDRRKVALFALCVSLTAGFTLATLAGLGLLSPWLLLGCCFLVGLGMALYSPSWQASVSEQVPREVLSEAVGLNAMSFNMARSVGPALGGALVAAAGPVAAFTGTAFGYVPLFVSMLLWRRKAVPSRLPPERIDRAVGAGVRYVVHSPPIRTVVLRTFATTFAGSSLTALMPLVVRDQLHSTAEVFGLLLGSFGVGAVIGGLILPRIRRAVSEEAAVSSVSILLGGVFAVVALSPWYQVTALVLVAGGICWTVSVTVYNVVIQTAAPRWVSGRLVASFQTAAAGGTACGAWFWGHVAAGAQVQGAMLIAGGAMAASSLLALVLRIPNASDSEHELVTLADPEVNLALTGRSGPIVVEIEYRVSHEDAREFYRRMMAVRLVRMRNGAFEWSMARHISDPEVWMERFSCPTWHDYLRLRDRNTADEMAIIESAREMIRPGHDIVVHRLLERPFGSVRWFENAPDM
ncbi:MAG TPA: MFS transporter [Novosphingobium sp.]|nr:MFS transporter [Novosphingobium sp.]